MKKIGKVFIIGIILFCISIALYITGKRHDIFIENNSSSAIKYSINGEPYKTLEAGKKVKSFSKGISNVIFFKTADDRVIEKDLVSKDINILVKETVENSAEWYKVIK